MTGVYTEDILKSLNETQLTDFFLKTEDSAIVDYGMSVRNFGITKKNYYYFNENGLVKIKEDKHFPFKNIPYAKYLRFLFPKKQVSIS